MSAPTPNDDLVIIIRRLPHYEELHRCMHIFRFLGEEETEFGLVEATRMPALVKGSFDIPRDMTLHLKALVEPDAVKRDKIFAIAGKAYESMLRSLGDSNIDYILDMRAHLEKRKKLSITSPMENAGLPQDVKKRIAHLFAWLGTCDLMGPKRSPALYFSMASAAAASNYDGTLRLAALLRAQFLLYAVGTIGVDPRVMDSMGRADDAPPLMLNKAQMERAMLAQRMRVVPTYANLTERLILPLILRMKHNRTLLEAERQLTPHWDEANRFAADFNRRLELRATEAIPNPPAGGRRIRLVDGVPVEPMCAACRKWDSDGVKLSRCAGCGKVMYCSRECQAKDWKEAHKAVCGK